jgi:hypothetical protein
VSPNLTKDMSPGGTLKRMSTHSVGGSGASREWPGVQRIRNQWRPHPRRMRQTSGSAQQRSTASSRSTYFALNRPPEDDVRRPRRRGRKG